MLLNAVPSSGYKFPTLDFSIPPSKGEGALYGAGTGVFKTAKGKKAAEKKAADKKAAEKTDATDAGIVAVSDAPPAPWLEQEVIIAGKPVKRKILVGVAGAALILAALTMTSTKIIRAV